MSASESYSNSNRGRQRIALWMTCFIAIVGILVIALLSWSDLPQKPSITLKDGRIFSFEGVTKIREPFYYEDSSFSGSANWIRLVKSVPRLSPFIKKMGLIPPFRRLGIAHTKPDDIAFWISTISNNGRNHGSSSNSMDTFVMNGVDIQIQDAASNQTFKISGGGAGGIDKNRSISHFSVRGLGKKSEKVLLILREKDEMGILQEKAVWEVELP